MRERCEQGNRKEMKMKKMKGRKRKWRRNVKDVERGNTGKGMGRGTGEDTGMSQRKGNSEIYREKKEEEEKLKEGGKRGKLKEEGNVDEGDMWMEGDMTEGKGKKGETTVV